VNTACAFHLPAALASRRAPLRALAFQALLERVWCEDPGRPGQGLLRPGAAEAVPALLAELGRAGSPHRDRMAWLLGLLASAVDERGEASLRPAIRAAVPVALAALDAQVASRRSGAAPADAPLGGLLFLLGHFDEEASRIGEWLRAALGRDAPAAQAVAAVFAHAADRPERSRAVLSYLGAEAWSTSCDARLPLYEQTLACPACRSRLAWHEEHIACTACGASFRWHGDIADLIPPGCSDPEQFPAALVEIYETQTRPRFLQVMGGDWEGCLTPEREQAYLERFLRPVPGPVLDLACGAGSRTRFVAAIAGTARVIALDYSLPMLEACCRLLPGVTPVRGSASALPFPDASLGGINCSDALQALPDPAQAFAEAGRCLRPGAPFTGFTFREATGAYAWFQHRFPAAPRQLFTDADLVEMAGRAGLEMADIGGPAQAIFFTAHKCA